MSRSQWYSRSYLDINFYCAQFVWRRASAIPAGYTDGEMVVLHTEDGEDGGSPGKSGTKRSQM